MGALYGILGEASPAELRALGDRLVHRGREAAEWSPGRGVHLGFRGPRRIVDVLEHGPVAFEGAIDNREEIARVLRRRAGDPAGLAHDGSLVFELIDAIGPEALSLLSGPFAVACWNGSARRLLLARDRVGHAPLYYAVDRERVVFASEYKALLALDGIHAVPDLDILQRIQLGGWSPPGQTCLRGILAVPPGTYLEVRRGTLSSRPYCELPRLREHVEVGAEASEPLLLAALERQVAGSGRIGVSLGGTPECALLGRAVRTVAGEREIHAIGIGSAPDDPGLRSSAELARSFGARHHGVVLDPEDLDALLPWLVWHLEEPAGDDEIARQLTTAREAARQVTVITTSFGLAGLAGPSRGPALRERLRRWTSQLRGQDAQPPRIRGAALQGPPAGGDAWQSAHCSIERLYAGAGVRLAAAATDPTFLHAAHGELGFGRRRPARARPEQLQVSDALDRMAVELLSPGSVRERGLFEPEEVARVLRRGRGRPYDEGGLRRVWTLLLTEVWARSFLDQRGAPPPRPLPPLRSQQRSSMPSLPTAGGVR